MDGTATISLDTLDELRKYISAMCITWQEQGRRQYTQIKKSWTCCMKRDREFLRTGSAAGKSL